MGCDVLLVGVFVALVGIDLVVAVRVVIMVVLGVRDSVDMIVVEVLLLLQAVEDMVVVVVVGTVVVLVVVVDMNGNVAHC